MMNKETHMLGKKNTPRPSRSRVFSSVVVVGYACSVLYADHIRYPPFPPGSGPYTAVHAPGMPRRFRPLRLVGLSGPLWGLSGTAVGPQWGFHGPQWTLFRVLGLPQMR